MDDRDVQMTMAAAGYYNGGIDGIIGPKSWAAVAGIETEFKNRYRFDPAGSYENRRLVAALQACLNKLGFEPGTIDGWVGPNTEEALNAFLFKKTTGRDEVIPRERVSGAPGGAAIPKQSEVAAVYGRPGAEVERRLKTIELPFSLRIDWNLRQTARRIRVHEEAADQLKAALVAVRDHYGPARMNELGIDRYAGCYNHRKIRGGTSWSMHAYGCAIDFYAAPNGLRTRCPDALFCKPDYTDFLDIMEAHEWLPAIRLWGADAMHFQRARLD
ncbi:peptidoglycan-binding protein [Chachezhania antarctica]|uniref:peptidoglycan-binding protein n=1 Tax=Chachezhania antarctica TaxID=2340860 RepID=UPI000EB4416D|nr:peptidoglycan-binding protein [Chachezhania antarctica]|tara:strand:+ start:558 stop:1373 length:816 start_codon:yes stop_codon:yes gene_type:complete